MFLKFNVAGQALILGFVPETFEILIFGIALVLVTVGLRWLMERVETNVRREIEKSK